MNLPSDTGVRPGGVLDSAPLQGFTAAPGSVGPFEFRSLTQRDMDAFDGRGELRAGNGNGQLLGGVSDAAAGETAQRKLIEEARQDGLQQGSREGRQAARTELEAEMRTAAAQERARLVSSVEQFRGVRERYFAEVEQEVVRLALAIAERVLHRETQMDALLLTAAVKVALEKMADRTGVVVRVAESDVKAWESSFAAIEDAERPAVVGDARLERGECVLETRMGTVELGVKVQLEEIEKGFFDLLNHRPVE